MALTWGQMWDTFLSKFAGPDDWHKNVHAKDEIDIEGYLKEVQRLRDLIPDDPGKQRKGRTSQFTPDTPIDQLAYQAAQWLTENWPGEAAKTGPQLFLAQRTHEILAGNFPAKYWDPCELVAEQTRKGLPHIDYNAPQPPPKFETPGSLNTKCTYSLTDPDTGNASNAGYTNAYGYFVDLFSKQKNYTFRIEAPDEPSTPRPLFALQNAHFSVSYSHDNRQAFSNLFKASLSPTQGGFRLEKEAVDQRGRFYYWHKAVPKIDPATLKAEMARRFVVDCNYKKWDDGYNDRTGGYALIQVAPAPPRGTYRFKNLSVFVDQTNTVELFVARAENDEDPEPTKNGFLFEVYQGDICDARVKPGYTGTYDFPAQVYLIPAAAQDTSKLPLVLKMWRDFRPEDPMPGFPATIPRVRFSESAMRAGNTCGPYLVGSAPLFGARPELVLHEWTMPWYEGDTRSKEAIARQDYDYWLGIGGISLIAGKSGWVPRSCVTSKPWWADTFRVRIYPDQITITWHWPDQSGSAVLKPGEPFPVLPPRPVQP